MNKIQKDLNLLPRYWKKIAYWLLTISIIFAILTSSKILTIDKEIAKTISVIGVLISLLILALTKNKVEDELVSKIRLKAFALSFIFGVVWVTITPIMNILFEKNFLFDTYAPQLLITMLIFYFLSFHSMLNQR